MVFTNEKVVDVGAFIAKIGVDISEIKEAYKSDIKFGIDVLAEIEKQILKAKEWENGALNDVDKIREIASKHKIDKVVIFPIPMANHNFTTGVKIYGRDYEKLAQDLGVYLLSSADVGENAVILDALEREHGITVYERA